MERIEGRRKNSTVIVHENFSYHTKSKKGPRTYLVCSKLKTCNGKAVMVDNVVKVNSAHNHGPDHDRISDLQFITSLKRRAEAEPNVSLRDIYNDEAAKFKKVRTSFSTIESTLSKLRRAVQPTKPTASVEEFLSNLSDSSFKLTSQGEPFFSARLQVNNSQTLIFISPLVSKKLSESSEIHIGVFNVVPAPFKLLCCLHLEYHNHYFPFAYALLTHNSRPDFNMLFLHLRNVLPALDPSFIVTDFNENIESACATVFLKAVVNGSYYCFGQTLWREMVLLDLEKFYDSSEQARRVLRMCLSLPLLPAHLMVKGMDVIREEMALAIEQLGNVRNPLQAILSYIENEWMTKFGRLSVWGQEKRTNNHVHFFHIQLKKKFGNNQSVSLWDFIEKLRTINESQSKDIEKIRNGNSLGSRKASKSKAFILSCPRILSAVEKLTLGQATVLRYLELVSDAIPEPTEDEMFGLDTWEIQNIKQTTELKTDGEPTAGTSTVFYDDPNSAANLLEHAVSALNATAASSSTSTYVYMQDPHEISQEERVGGGF